MSWIPLEEVPHSEVPLQWPERALSNTSQYSDDIHIRGAKREKGEWVVKVILTIGGTPKRVIRTLYSTISNRLFCQLPIHPQDRYERDVYLERQPK